MTDDCGPVDIRPNSRLPQTDEPKAGAAAPEHLCGLQGFGALDICPACEASATGSDHSYVPYWNAALRERVERLEMWRAKVESHWPERITRGPAGGEKVSKTSAASAEATPRPSAGAAAPAAEWPSDSWTDENVLTRDEHLEIINVVTSDEESAKMLTGWGRRALRKLLGEMVRRLPAVDLPAIRKAEVEKFDEWLRLRGYWYSRQLVASYLAEQGGT